MPPMTKVGSSPQRTTAVGVGEIHIIGESTVLHFAKNLSVERAVEVINCGPGVMRDGENRRMSSKEICLLGNTYYFTTSGELAVLLVLHILC